MGSGFGAQLKEACQITNAAWAALAEREGGHWLVRASHHLAKPKLPILVRFLHQESVDAWMAGALSGGGNRSALLPPDTKLDAARLYVFSLPSTSQVVLVAGSQLSAANQRVWKLVASLLGESSRIAPDETLT